MLSFDWVLSNKSPTDCTRVALCWTHFNWVNQRIHKSSTERKAALPLSLYIYPYKCSCKFIEWCGLQMQLRERERSLWLRLLVENCPRCALLHGKTRFTILITLCSVENSVAGIAITHTALWCAHSAATRFAATHAMEQVHNCIRFLLKVSTSPQLENLTLFLSYNKYDLFWKIWKFQA